MITIGISGSRGYDDYRYFKNKIDYYISRLKGEIQFCSGGAHSGADNLIKKYCSEQHYSLITHLPDYATHGKKAPILRKSLIVRDSDLMIFFWDGKSKGTEDTINKAKKKNIKIKIVNI